MALAENSENNFASVDHKLSTQLSRRSVLVSFSTVLALTACGGDKKSKSTAAPMPALPAIDPQPPISGGDPDLTQILGPIIQPGKAWTGIAGTGFAGSWPVDPDRITAKPVLRLLVPPNQSFSNMLVVGVIAGANNRGDLGDRLGLEKILVHFEGNSKTLDEPSVYTFGDVNGQTRSYLGWWVTLKKPADRAGQAQVYFEAVPEDKTIQNRVIGPYQFNPVDTLHDYEIEVVPSQSVITGSRYQTIGAAVSYLVAQSARNPKITVTEDLADSARFWSNVVYTPEGYFHFYTAPGVNVRFAVAPDSPDNTRFFRPRVDGCWFHGSGFVFDFEKGAGGIYHEIPSGRQHVFEGTQFVNSEGSEASFRGSAIPAIYICRDFPYYLECAASDLRNAYSGASLVRGCRAERVLSDFAQYASAILYSECFNNSPGEWRQKTPAFSVIYVGDGTGTLELSGGNETNNRVLHAKVDGSSVGTFTIQSTEAAFNADTNYRVASVVSWLNRLPGFRATLIDDSRRASMLSHETAGTLGGAFGPLNLSGGQTFHTVLDIHSDFWQPGFTSDSPSNTNVVIFGNKVWKSATQLIAFGSTAGHYDYLFINNVFDYDESYREDFLVDGTSIASSQAGHLCSHVVVAHNSWTNQRFTFQPTIKADGYSIFSNNVLPYFAGTGTLPARVDNHVFDTNRPIPSGSIGTVKAGNRDTLFVDADGGDFTPSGELLTNLKQPALAIDAGGKWRVPPSPVGAFFA